MFCQNCGKEISENAKFCSSCGAKIEIPVAENITVQNDKEETTTVEKFTKQNISSVSNLSDKSEGDKKSVNKKSSVLDKKINNKKIKSVQKVVLGIVRSFSIFLWIVAGFSVLSVIPICVTYYRIGEKTRVFGCCNISVYYNTSKYSEEKIEEILNSYGKSLNVPTDACLYFGRSKNYIVEIENALLLAKVEAYQYGDNDYQETLFSNIYSNYNDAKEKFDSLCKEYKSEITWKFWKW